LVYLVDRIEELGITRLDDKRLRLFVLDPAVDALARWNGSPWGMGVAANLVTILPPSEVANEFVAWSARRFDDLDEILEEVVTSLWLLTTRDDAGKFKAETLRHVTPALQDSWCDHKQWCLCAVPDLA
jgi:hypothetical protein